MDEQVNRIVLASGSPRRKELFGRLGLPFSVQPADIDEQVPEREAPLEYVCRMAREKARVVAMEASAGLVIGADTIGELDGEVLVKPASPEEATGMLLRMSGRTHVVHSAVCLYLDGELYSEFLSSTRVSFRPLSGSEIGAYVRGGEGLDKAGAYAIQGEAASFVARIEGCYHAVVGLPLSQLAQQLMEAGFQLWPDRVDS